MAMDRAMDTSTSSAIPPAILSRRTLNIKDLDELIALLERHHYNKASYHQLGLRLKLSYNTLEKIKKNHGEVDPCFTECLAGWLRKPDGVETPTIDTLIAALRGIEENAVADGIEGERQRILAPAPMAAVPLSRSDEPMVATPPTSHTSEGHPIQPVTTVNPGVVDLELKIDRYPELQEIANNLQGKYDFLVSALEKSLKDHQIDVKRAKRLIERCLMTKAGVVSELMPCIDIFEKANDFESFFDFLSKYKFIGYINYKLLKKLAELVKDDEINDRFYEYEKEYTKLLSSAYFQDIIPLLERKSELSPTAPLGLPYVSFHLERPWLHTVVYIWISTFGEFSWSSYALLKQLRENCVIITYAILPCVLDDVIRDLNDPVVLKRLEDEDVTVIEIIESPQKEEDSHLARLQTINKEEASGEEQINLAIELKLQQSQKMLEDVAKDVKDLDLDSTLKQHDEDAIKDLEAKKPESIIELEDKLKEFEKELEKASNELKVKEEILQKQSEESIKEKDRLIKKLIEKLETKEAEIKEAKITHEEYLSKAMANKDRQIAQLIKRNQITQSLQDKLRMKEAEMEEVTTHAGNLTKEMSIKDSQIVQLVNNIQSLEEKLKQQIQETKEKLEEEKQICRKKIEEVNKTYEMEHKIENMHRKIEEQLQIIMQDVIQRMGQRFEGMDVKIDEMIGQKMEDICKKMDQKMEDICKKMDQKMEGMGQKMGDMDQKMEDKNQKMKDTGLKIEDMDQKMKDMGQKMEDIGQQLEGTNENLNNVKQEVATLKEKIKPSAPPITGEAVTESYSIGASPDSIATLSKPQSDTNVEPYFDRLIDETDVTEVTKETKNDENDKKL